VGFILSFNNEDIPQIHKDEEYLRDTIRLHLNIDTSEYRNKLEKETILNKIKSIKNCIITYKKRTLLKESYPSSLLENLNGVTTNGTLTYTVSNKYNAYTLAKLLDQYIKYGTTTPTLKLLNANYSIPYHTYSNEFTGLPKQKLWSKLQEELNLSYTKVDNYNKCAFSYYINYILKLYVNYP